MYRVNEKEPRKITYKNIYLLIIMEKIKENLTLAQ